MKKEKNNSNYHVWLAHFQRSECSLTSFKRQLKTVSFQESYQIYMYWYFKYVSFVIYIMLHGDISFSGYTIQFVWK